MHDPRRNEGGEGRLQLVAIKSDEIRFDILDRDGYAERRAAVTITGNGHVVFPSVSSESLASTGDKVLDAEIVRRAREELVRLHAAVVIARRIANGAITDHEEWTA
jgi:hypothetical protein